MSRTACVVLEAFPYSDDGGSNVELEKGATHAIRSELVPGLVAADLVKELREVPEGDEKGKTGDGGTSAKDDSKTEDRPERDKPFELAPDWRI